MLAKLPKDFKVDDTIRLYEAQYEALAGSESPSISNDTLAGELLHQAQQIQQGSALLPSLELGLFAAGRISYPALTARLRWKEKAYLERDKVDKCSISFSLVPANITGLAGDNDGVRGQWLTMGIKYMSEDFELRDLHSLRFDFADGVGGDDLERPPNGHPTAAALERCRTLIPEAVGEVRRLAPFRAGALQHALAERRLPLDARGSRSCSSGKG